MNVATLFKHFLNLLKIRTILITNNKMQKKTTYFYVNTTPLIISEYYN
jgi:hypothetical protein